MTLRPALAAVLLIPAMYPTAMASESFVGLLDWTISRPIGDTVISLNISAPDGALCNGWYEFWGRHPQDPGESDFGMIVETAQGGRHAFVSSGARPQEVFVGDLVFLNLIAVAEGAAGGAGIVVSPYWGAFGWFSQMPVDGWTRLTFAARNLEPWDAPFEGAGEESLKIQIQCKGVAAVAATGSHEMHLAGANVLQGALGAGAIDADLYVGGSVRHAVQGPAVEFWSGEEDCNLRRLRLFAPGAVREWLMSPVSSWATYSGQAGGYTLALDGVAACQTQAQKDGWWYLLASLGPLSSSESL